MESITTGVIHNIALLIVFSMISNTLPLSKLKSKVLKRMLKGLVIGLIGISIMYDPVILKPGIMFDGRTILLSTSGLFFGSITTSVAAIMMMLLRIYQGGSGIYMGVMVIITSTLLGLAMRKYRYVYLKQNKNLRWLEFYSFGIVVHLVMLFFTILLPTEIRADVLNEIAFTVLGVYPIGVLMLSMFLMNNEERKSIEQKNLSLFDYNTANILVTSKNTNEVVEANKAAVLFLGYQKEDLLGITTNMLILSNTVKSSFDEKEKQNRFFAKIKRGDGTLIDVQIQKYITIVGNEELVYHIIQDRTEYTKVKHDAILKNLVKNSITTIIQDIIIIYDDDFQVQECSRSFEEFIRLEKQQIIGFKINELVKKQNMDWLWVDEEINLNHNEKIVKIHTKEDQIFYFSLITSNFKNIEINYSGHLIIARDMTRYKERENELIHSKLVAEKATETQKKFLANMSHEIRTPLNGVMGMIELTLMDDLSNEGVENLTIAKESAKILLDTISDILDYSKLDFLRMDVNNEYFTLEDLVLSIKQIYEILAIEKGLEFEVVIDEGCPKQIKSDRVRLMQVISNLIGNGIKFTHKGKVTLHIEHQFAENNLVELKIRIIDTGIGIKPEKQGELFQGFSQIDDSYTREFGGLGLGLAISKESIDLLGGKIICESVYGEGSEFSVIMNLDYSTDNLEQSNETEIITKSDRNNKEVLIVDDDLVNLKLLRSLLEKNGYLTTIAENGAIAVGLVEHKQFELILMDISMPVMDGVQATEIIRKIDEKKGIRTPVLAVTAFALLEDEEKLINAGLDDYISKPIDFNMLILKVEEWSNKSISIPSHL